MAAFEAGNIAAPMATIYLNHEHSNLPMYQWSVLNQLSVLISGCEDARGFNQWKAVKRKVKKGEKAQASILIPLMKKAEDDDGEEIRKVYGFKGCAVFDIEQTEGEPLPDDEKRREFVESLPLVHVAE
ncbi:MAG: ArdC family protein, partial [bacterium]|nr:ArdC family protein [bacterium]